MAKQEEPAIKVNITTELQVVQGDWWARCARPKLEVVGITQGQVVDRITAQLRKHYGEQPFEVAIKLVLPKEFQERVDAHKQLLDQIDAMTASAEVDRLPLAKDLQRVGVMQRQAAEIVRLTPTYLGVATRKADTGITSSTTTRSKRAPR